MVARDAPSAKQANRRGGEEEQRVEGRQPLYPKSDTLDSFAEEALVVPSEVATSLILAAPYPLVCGNGDRHTAAGPDDTNQLPERRCAVLDVLNDVECSDEVKVPIVERNCLCPPVSERESSARPHRFLAPRINVARGGGAELE